MRRVPAAARVAGWALAACLVVVAARAELLLDEWEEVGGTIVFADHERSSGRCWYMPEARIGRRDDGTPDLTFLKYTKTGQNETLNGGVLRFTVGLGLAPARLDDLRRKLGTRCPRLGPVPFKSGEFLVVSAALGEGGVFTRNIVGEGRAPLISGSEAAVSIAVTPEGATFLERALRDTNHGIDVVFDMTYSGLSAEYQADATIDWDKVRRFTESVSRRRVLRRRERHLGIWRWVWYVQDSSTSERLTDVLRSQGAIEVRTIGQDENLAPILQLLTDQVMNVIADTQLALPGEEAPDEEGEGGKEKDARGYGSHVTVKTVERHGRASISLRSRQRLDRESGPIAADLGGELRRFGDDRRVYRLIDLDDPDFETQTISATLDIEGFDAFGDYINYATVHLRKRYRDPSRSDHSGSLSFNRRSFEDSGNVLEWSFPRLGEADDEWLSYDVRESWSFAGGVTWETDWRRVDLPFLALSPPLVMRTVDLAIDPDVADEQGVRLVAVTFRNLVGESERVQEVRVRPSEGAWTEHRYYHAPGDLGFRYRIVWYRAGAREEGPWTETTDSFIDLTYPTGHQIGVTP